MIFRSGFRPSAKAGSRRLIKSLLPCCGGAVRISRGDYWRLLGPTFPRGATRGFFCRLTHIANEFLSLNCKGRKNPLWKKSKFLLGQLFGLETSYGPTLGSVMSEVLG